MSAKMYCVECGKAMSREAIACPECGAPTRNYRAAATNYQSGSRDKGVAIVLAVFFGLWTWLYTYKIDSSKFWANFIASIVTLGIWGIVAWIWAIVESAARPTSFYLNYPHET